MWKFSTINIKDHIAQFDFTEYKNFSGDRINADTFFSLPPTLALRDEIINGADFTSKAGNVPEAFAYGVKASTSIRLGFMGLKDAVVGLSYTYEKTETTNQFNRKKSIFDWRSPHEIGFNFRHDLTKYGFSYGFNGVASSGSESNDINYRWVSQPAIEFNAFAEYILFDGIKMRLEAENINTNKWDTVFYNYVDHIRFDEFDGRTTSLYKSTTEVTLSIQGTF